MDIRGDDYETQQTSPERDLKHLSGMLIQPVWEALAGDHSGRRPLRTLDEACIRPHTPAGASSTRPGSLHLGEVRVPC